MDARAILANAFYLYDAEISPRQAGEWADRQLEALAVAGYRVIKVDEDTKARAVEAMRGPIWHETAVPDDEIDDGHYLRAAQLALDAALAVLGGGEHE